MSHVGSGHLVSPPTAISPPIWANGSVSAGDRVSMDMIGPFVRSISGQRQWGLVAVDHYSRFGHVFFLGSKDYDHVLPCVRKLFSEYAKHGHRIREIKTDPGSEFGTVVDSQNSLSTLE